MISIDEKRLNKIGAFIRTLPDCQPTDWTFPGLPGVGDPRTIDFFFTAVKHQYGFWYDDGERYLGPMYGKIGGKKLKGSDFIWHSLIRAMEESPSILKPEKQALMSDKEIAAVFSDDAGNCPLPVPETHFRIWRSYARELLAAELTPVKIVEKSRIADKPVRRFMVLLSRIGGYKEDPLSKKAALLTMILINRPERFFGAPEGRDLSIPPIVDYHIMRSCLRTGLVRIVKPELESRIRDRKLISGEEEAVIRKKVYELIFRLAEISGKGVDAIDWIFFRNRTGCPEMTEPNCLECALREVCARKKDLFQPVIRTTFY